jgi:DNA adenine methylase
MGDEVTYRRAKPLKPAAGYVGGKKILAQRIVTRINAIPHDTYAEVFVGMGGVFFRRARIPKAEVINDRSGDVANFFRVLQRHYVQLMDTLKWQITGRSEFERLRASDPDTLTDLERAARFLYLQRTTFGGKVLGRTFGVDPAGARFNVTKLAPLLEELHERLAGVTIECLPWRDFMRRYDRPGTLFYLDPPYYGTEHVYGRGLFARSDYAELAEMLVALRGRFILSLNDVPEVRSLFARFQIASVPVTYTVASGRARRAKEVLITRRPVRG